MNHTKPKTVFDERDALRREVELLKSTLGVTTSTLALMTQSLAESRKLVAELNGEIDQLKSHIEAVELELKESQVEVSVFQDENERLIGKSAESSPCPPACTESASPELSQLRAVADAAVAHQIACGAESKVTRMPSPDWRDGDAKEIWIHACDILMNAEESALLALGRAVREYRKLSSEKCAVEWREEGDLEC